MPRRNRVDPWGDLHAVNSRGMFTGNRGCVVDDAGQVVRHHRSALWIVCLTEFRGWRVALARPGRWTPLFFLDDAVALAAGHRPCAVCRRTAYRSYRDAASLAVGAPRPLLAVELDRRLVAERHRRGTGIDRATDRRLWASDIDDLPAGTVIVEPGAQPRLVLDDRLLAFTFDGWGAPVGRPTHLEVQVLTPPISVAALRFGYQPALHSSAAAIRQPRPELGPGPSWTWAFPPA